MTTENDTLYLDMLSFVALLTKKQAVPDRLKEIADWHADIRKAVRAFGKRIAADIESYGKTLYSRFGEARISFENYMKVVRQLAMYEFLVNRDDWPEFATAEEKRGLQQREAVETLKKDTLHFEQEFQQFGDLNTAEDIAGQSARIVPLPEQPVTKWQKEAQRKRLG